MEFTHFSTLKVPVVLTYCCDRSACLPFRLLVCLFTCLQVFLSVCLPVLACAMMTQQKAIRRRDCLSALKTRTHARTRTHFCQQSQTSKTNTASIVIPTKCSRCEAKCPSPSIANKKTTTTTTTTSKGTNKRNIQCAKLHKGWDCHIVLRSCSDQ